MHNQRGFSLIELLLVVIVLGIIAAIAIPSLMVHAKNDTTATFNRCFGVPLKPVIRDQYVPVKRLLTEDQKELLRPLVATRLQVLCDNPSKELDIAIRNRADFMNQPASTEPSELAARLKRSLELDEAIAAGRRTEASRIRECTEAQDVVRRLGIFPVTP